MNISTIHKCKECGGTGLIPCRAHFHSGFNANCIVCHHCPRCFNIGPSAPFKEQINEKKKTMLCCLPIRRT